MVDSHEGIPAEIRQIHRVDVQLGEELAYIEKPYRDHALSLARRAIELKLPDDMRDIILKEVNTITQTGVRAARDREMHLWRRWLEDCHEENGELFEP
jgi:hypothetical protein